MLDGFLMLEYLIFELQRTAYRRERVIISLAKEFHTACFCQFLKALQHLRSIAIELLERTSRNGERYLERTIGSLDGLQEGFVHRQVTLLSHSLKDGPIREVIIIMRIFAYIEKSI